MLAQCCHGELTIIESVYLVHQLHVCKHIAHSNACKLHHYGIASADRGCMILQYCIIVVHPGQSFMCLNADPSSHPVCKCPFANLHLCTMHPVHAHFIQFNARQSKPANHAGCCSELEKETKADAVLF